MAEDGLKGFTVNWILGGLLMCCLLAFSLTFILANNPTNGLTDGTENVFSSSYVNYSTKLRGVANDSDNLLNITSNTNPEVSDLGSRDSVAVSFGAKGSTTSYWDSSKKLLGWVFSGDTGKILLGVIGGLVGFLSLFYIWRAIKTGT